MSDNIEDKIQDCIYFSLFHYDIKEDRLITNPELVLI